MSVLYVLCRMQRYMMLCYVTRSLENTALSSCTFFAVPDVSEQRSESLLHSHCPHLHLLQLQLSKLRKGGPLHSLHWLKCRQRQRSQMPQWASPFPPLSHSSPASALTNADRTELFSLSAHKCRTGRSFQPQRSQVPDRTELCSLSAHKCRIGRSSSASALTNRTELFSLRPHKCRTGRSFPASALTNVRTGRSSLASALTSAGQDRAL
jgi:hypothetical protein